MADGLQMIVDDDGLSAMLGRVSPEVVDGAHKVVTKGALNIKESMADDFYSSRHFRHLGRSVGFDQVGLTAEIGPDKAKVYGKGEYRTPGNLAVIAYFGGANGGGGTVRDPQRAAEEEAPRFMKALLDVIDGAMS